ncbi:lipoprotein-releasing ABC transporter permease subunit [Zavarzinia compransoris]|uniref:lipoprotein-releasing ABC transporter permease subunit n=1 Tax=Zavarzinia marina TaxID=2911065 RepID=UPI001F1A21AE|nr:lipoprotein-releasing ABC transporter permease subunit [Zavarzinia marina]MCF4164584.1 lipoprotein-releasing ABC transporter permease subunit [Zavarzinia marina]
MFRRFEWVLAGRYLRARRQEGFISIIAWFSLLGIGLGVATLIIVMAVMNGFRAELMGRILGINGHVIVQAQVGPVLDYDDLAKRFEGLPEVVSAMPMVEAQVMVSARGQAGGGLVRGLSQADLARLPLVSDNIVAGSIDAFEGDDVVMLGDRMADRMGLSVGDRVTIVSPNGTTTVAGTTPRMKAYRIVGLFSMGMAEYDNTFIFMPVDPARAFFRTGPGVSAIEVMLTDPDASAAVAEKLRAMGGGTPLRAMTWQVMNATFFGALAVERNVMFLILTLIIVVAAFNIISSLIMLVKDKGRGIAILRTMGASRASIMRVFLICGASIGVIGTLGGFVLGVVFCDNIEAIRQFLQSLTGARLFPDEIYFLSRIPAKMEVDEVVTVVLMGLALSFLATLYPSWRAARLDPVEALRNE